MKSYLDIDWNKVKNHLRNHEAICRLQQIDLIDKDAADALEEACEEKIKSFLFINYP